jgi:cyclic pyranopterin phosphate synthase
MAELSHLDSQGNARMVDVGQKPSTARRAVAETQVQLGSQVLAALVDGKLAKGDAFGVARIAGIQAAKRTADWIPLCHQVALDRVEVRFETDAAIGLVRVLCEAAAVGRTGVEMEAMVGAAAAALTLYDMCKAMNRGIRIDGLRLIEKVGGKSGRFVAPDVPDVSEPGQEGA